MIISNKKKFLYYLILIICATLIITPLIFAVLLSFSNNKDILNANYIPGSISFANYIRACELQPFPKYITNSLISAISSTSLQIITGLLAAYAFVFINFKYKNAFFTLFLATMMIPSEVLVVSNFQTIRHLNFLDTFQGLVLPSLASTFSIFLLRQNMKQIPYELKEASEVAGVSDFGFFIKIVVPMVKNAIVTLGIYNFLVSWNSYMWPLLSTTKDTVRTVQIGLRQLNAMDAVNDYSMIAAGSIIVALPTLIIIFLGQGRLEEGLSKGAIK